MRRILTIATMFLSGLMLRAGAGPIYLSPEAIVADAGGTTLFVAAHTAAKIVVVDAGTGKVLRDIPLKANPTGLAFTSDRTSLLVTTDGPRGELLKVDPVRGRITARVFTGHTPMAPTPSPDGRTVYVCNRFNNNVAVVDAARMKVELSIPVLREPIAAALTPDGKRLFVANHLPAGAASGDYVGAAVSVLDPAARQVVTNLALPNGSTGVRGMGLSPDGKHVYVTHTLGRYQLPTTQLDRGWMNTSALSVIDAANGTWINAVLLDDVDLGAANPWGVTCTPDGATLVVAHAGTAEVSLIDRAVLHERMDKAGRGERVTEVSARAEDVPNDLSFLNSIRRRVKLPGLGPRGVVAVAGKVITADYFSDTLSVVNLAPGAPPAPATVALGPAQEITVARRGEMLFNDATMCFQHWQSCASCHPDGRADALNWDLLNDGIGNPKQTKSLLLSHRTPPVMVTGIRPNAEYATRTGMRFIQFIVRPDEDAVAIDEYCKAMKPVPSPYLDDGSLSRAARRGRKTFESSCASCHPAPLFTDLKPYDVGTGEGSEAGKKFDVPTLVEMWRTSPYLYDGRASTMEQVLTTFNKEDRHGLTSKLSEAEIKDLAEYILSL